MPNHYDCAAVVITGVVGRHSDTITINLKRIMKHTTFTHALLPLVVSLFLVSCQANSQTAPAAEDAPATAPPAKAEPYKNVDASQFGQLMENSETVVLDIRTPGEIAQGKIAGAVEMDFYQPDFQEKIRQLDKSKTYLVYCRSGGRSRSACQMMQQEGFAKLYNLNGGYLEWEAANQQD